jgi:hypothetical protein
MDDGSKPKEPRMSRAAQRATDSGAAGQSSSEKPIDVPATPQSSFDYLDSNARAKIRRNGSSIAAIAIPSCCLLIFLAVVAFPGAFFGLIWSLLTSGQQSSYDPEPMVQSTNAPAVQSFLTDVSNYGPQVSRFTSWGSAVGAYGMNCPDGSDPSGDSCLYVESARAAEPDDQAACKEAFSIAENFGVTTDVIIGETDGMPFGKGSLKRCVTMLSSYPRSVGWGWFGPEYYIKGTTDEGTPWVMLLTRSQQTSAANSSNNKNGKLNVEEYGYTITVGTDFGNAYSGVNEGPNYSDNKVQAAAMLDTIAYYRRSNKPLGFFTKELVDQVLPIYKEIFRFDGSVKSHANADGNIHWVQMNFKDGATWCVSIGEGKDLTTGGDSTLGMGMDETGLPGGTVELAGLGKAIKSKEATHRFGDYVVGACK